VLRINDAVTIPFVLDSGAGDISVPEDVFKTLMRTRTVTESDLLTPGTYVLADGSEHLQQRFVLHELRVGHHVVNNVTASVAPDKADPLLGQSFLKKLPAWTVDNERHVLFLNNGKGETGRLTARSQQLWPHGFDALIRYLLEVRSDLWSILGLSVIYLLVLYYSLRRIWQGRVDQGPRGVPRDAKEASQAVAVAAEQARRQIEARRQVEERLRAMPRAALRQFLLETQAAGHAGERLRLAEEEARCTGGRAAGETAARELQGDGYRCAGIPPRDPDRSNIHQGSGQWNDRVRVWMQREAADGNEDAKRWLAVNSK
jgi:hypothetical protein